MLTVTNGHNLISNGKAEAIADADHDPFYRTANYPLVHDCDMEPGLKDEATDLCVAAAEKYKDNLEKATQVAKEALDKKFGGKWHIIMGYDFAYEVTHEVISRECQLRSLLHVFVGGKMGILAWKLA